MLPPVVPGMPTFQTRCRMGNTQARLAPVLLTLLLVAGCSRIPDCDSGEAERLVRETIFSLARSEFRSDGNPAISELPMPEPKAVVQSPRQEQITDAFLPRLAIRTDVQWLKYRIAPQVAERHRIHPFPLYLMLDRSAILRKAVRVRLSDHELLPNRQEGTRVYTKVCRARLWIEPMVDGATEATPVTLTYSANAPPSASKLHGANPFYVAINFFDATEPAPGFELSDREKVTLMVFGATRDMRAIPPPQSADAIITRRALRALRRYYELTPSPNNVPYPG